MRARLYFVAPGYESETIFFLFYFTSSDVPAIFFTTARSIRKPDFHGMGHLKLCD